VKALNFTYLPERVFLLACLFRQAVLIGTNQGEVMIWRWAGNWRLCCGLCCTINVSSASAGLKLGMLFWVFLVAHSVLHQELIRQMCVRASEGVA